jgi:DNA repair protein RecN (Recombination protein N)
MLQRLHILNFALIEEVTIDLNKGFTVITGETGSGKSILLNALNLILGERADFAVIGSKSNKSIVEATFLVSDRLKTFFQENDLDFENTLLVRREILKEGKSRAFVNDTPVQLNVLKNLCSQLVQIHSQYNTLELKSKVYQLEILDILAGLEIDRTKIASVFNEYQRLKKQLSVIDFEFKTAQATQDYNQFVLNELEELNLDKTDFVQLEIELNRMENSEVLKALYYSILNSAEENGFYSNLKSVKNGFDKFAVSDTNLASFSERLNSILIEIKELSSDAEKAIGDLESTGFNSEELTTKLDQYNRVMSKHRITNQESLMSFRDEMQGKVVGLEKLDEQCQMLREELQLKFDMLTELSEKLHLKRLQAAPGIEHKLKGILNSLKLPDTDLRFELKSVSEINSFGNSEISFLFSANKGLSPVPVEKAASGGELSRVMLALQKMVSEKRELPTILFDEIDTGVSGDVAQKIGLLLNQMGETVQLIAISHLPQVASKAENHLIVKKQVENNEMKTSVQVITEDQRVIEIARLLSGEKISDAALSNAKNLMLN